MSKKRLRNKNKKTKKKIRGGSIRGGSIIGGSIIGGLKDSLKSDLKKEANSLRKEVASEVQNEAKSLKSDVQNEAEGLKSDVQNEAKSLKSDVQNEAKSLKSDVQNEAEGLKSDVQNDAEGLKSDVQNEAEGLNSEADDVTKGLEGDLSNLEGELGNLEGKVTDEALNTVPGASAALDIASGINSGINSAIEKLMVPPTPGDKFRQALMIINTIPDFKIYIEESINKKMVSEFYKILATLGNYSEKYSDSVKKIAEITGASIFDDDVDFYSDLNVFSSGMVDKDVVESDCTMSPELIKDEELQKLNVDKLLENADIEMFLENTMIIGVPVIKNIFEDLGKTIDKYKQLRSKINALFEKKNDIQKYFEDFRQLSNEANEQINAIFHKFDTSNMSGGLDCSSEGNEPTIPSDKEDFKQQSHFYDPNTNTGCAAESAEKLDKLTKMYEDKKNRIDAKYDFYNTLLKICISGRSNLSKLMKQKLYTILNRILKRLYDIANTKKIINGDEINDDEDFSGSEYEYLKEGEDKNVDVVLPDNLEDSVFHETILNTTKQLICTIQKKTNIDTQSFKDVVKPAFIRKKEQFRELVKIWSTDVSEKEKLIKKLKGVVDDDIQKYIIDLKAQLKIAVDSQKDLKEYIKSGKEREKEDQNNREKELAIELKKGADNFKKQENIQSALIEKADKENSLKRELETEKMIEKRKENDEKFKEKLEKDGDKVEKGEEARKKAEEARILRNRKGTEEEKRLENIKSKHKDYLQEQKDAKEKSSLQAEKDKQQKENKENAEKFKTDQENDGDRIEKGEAERKKAEEDKKNARKKADEDKKKAEEAKEEAKKNAEEETKKNLTNFLKSANAKNIPKENFVAVSRTNYASIFIVKHGEQGYYFYKTNCKKIMTDIDNNDITNGATTYNNINTIKNSYYLIDKSQINEFCNLKKAFTGGTTRKFSSPVSQKTRRRRRTSQ